MTITAKTARETVAIAELDSIRPNERLFVIDGRYISGVVAVSGAMKSDQTWNDSHRYMLETAEFDISPVGSHRLPEGATQLTVNGKPLEVWDRIEMHPSTGAYPVPGAVPLIWDTSESEWLDPSTEPAKYYGWRILTPALSASMRAQLRAVAQAILPAVATDAAQRSAIAAAHEATIASCDSQISKLEAQKTIEQTIIAAMEV
jgi:hypothetical protein